MGFGGGTFTVFCCFSVGGCGGANFGRSGTFAGGTEMGTDDPDPVEQVDGGFGGAIGGGFKMDKSSSTRDGGFGAGIDGGWRASGSKLFKSPMKSGGGGMKSTGGGGGAIEGGGGTNIFSSWPDAETTDILEERSPEHYRSHKLPIHNNIVYISQLRSIFVEKRIAIKTKSFHREDFKGLYVCL